MRIFVAPLLWLGRISLWVLILPVGIWRSLRHHRKKGERRTLAKLEKRMAKRIKETET